MTYDEALQNKIEHIASSKGAINEEKIYIIPEIPEEADEFLKFILRGAIKYSDELCINYSSNGKFSVWIAK